MENRRELLMLICAAAIWGLSFPALKYALGAYDTFAIMAARFTLAALLLAGFAFFAKLWPNKAELRLGLLAGFVLFLSFATQVYGQKSISPPMSAFITGLYILFVPLFHSILARVLPEKKVLLAVLLSALGLWLLSGASFSAGLGEFLTLLCAVFFAMHILILSKGKDARPLPFTLVQMAVAAILSFPFLLLEGLPTAVHPGELLSIAYLGIFASAVAFLLQTAAQRKVHPNSTALIFISEPLFATIFSVLFFSEILSLAQMAGGALILFALYISQK